MSTTRHPLTISTILLLGTIAVLGAGHAAAADTAPHCPRMVVRAYFDDPTKISEATRWTDPWEINTTEGYLIVDVDAGGVARLESAGFRVVKDEELTQMMCEPPRPLKDQKSGIVGLPCYRTVDETFADVQRLVDAYPDLTEWIDIGNSWEKNHGRDPGFDGEDLMVLKLTNRATQGVGTPADPDSKPVLFVVGGLHSRECAPPELLTRFAEGLLESYDSDADATWLLDEHEIHLLIFANPDGRLRAQQRVWWRKNANNNHCTDSELRGVDLNRNFEFLWNCCGQSSGEECDLTYHGSGPASEPETQAVQNYARSIFPDQWTPEPPDDATGVFLDIHSYGRQVFWPWFHRGAPPPNWAGLKTLGRKLAYFNAYSPEEVSGALDGSAVDFAYGELGIASFLFELGTAFFQNCGYFESTIVPQHLDALLYAAKIARTPYITPAGPDVFDIDLRSGRVLVEGEPLQISARTSDGRYQNSNGAEPSQNVVAVEVFLDTPPWHDEPGTSWEMSPEDGAFDSSIERVEVNIDTANLDRGRHTLFFRARDADGVWGAVSAEFFWIYDPFGPVRRPGGRVSP
jgi:hypothetical protein